MKFTFNWLKEYLNTDKSLAEITERLTAIGLEVEEISNPVAGLKDFIVAEIKDVKNHPDSDHLHLLKVDTGAELLQIVCGAPNVRVGLKGVLARPGCVIPCNGETLKVGKIRGIESFGMMCSSRELGLGDGHDGILDLDTDAALGTSFADIIGSDAVIEVNVTPNRPDAFGVLGIARDLAAAGMGVLKPEADAMPDIKSGFKSPIGVKLSPSGCPIFVGRYIKGVKNVKSPKWLQDYLKAVGLRPISALVDVTNYLNIGRCRPLHVFDADKLSGDIEVRFAREGEKITTLDEKEHTLTANMTVIADASGALSIAGIMGGEGTGVTDDTVNVFLESAWFEPMNIAATGRALNIESDSRTRFERGVDAASSLKDSAIAAKLIMDLCGGEVSEPVIAGTEPKWQREIAFNPERVERLCGVAVPAETSFGILKSLGFTQNGTKFTPPSWRPDVEGEADLVEEVMRIYGYDRLPALSMLSDKMPKAFLTINQKKAMSVRRSLAARGGNQAITWSFMDSRVAKLFNSKGVMLLNPIASNLDEMRPSILPNLLAAVQRNADRGYTDLAIFEVGPVFTGPKPTQQEEVATMVRSGFTHARNWLDARREVDVFDVKADALAALAAVDTPVDNLQVWRTAPSYYHTGRSGALCLGKEVLAYFGEIHPAVLKAMDIKERIVACEVFLDRTPSKILKTKTQKKLSLSQFQTVKRDFAFVLPKDIDADKLVRAIKGVDKTLITGVNVFDLYEGENVGADKKSLAVEVTLSPMERTLTDAEIEAVASAIISSAAEHASATLRA